ncbi:MAG: hypothetical protein ACLFQ8_01575 [Candidatus Aenigmatarchaeota archaeon]
MPESGAPYKRGYTQTKSKGSRQNVRCSFCGRRVPRFKAFKTKSGMTITDPEVREQVDDKDMHLPEKTQWACPKCARFRGIVEPRKGQG